MEYCQIQVIRILDVCPGSVLPCHAELNWMYPLMKTMQILKKPADQDLHCFPCVCWSFTGVTALCPWARHIDPSLVLVQPRKTCPFITEGLLMGRKESNQTNKSMLKLSNLTICYKKEDKVIILICMELNLWPSQWYFSHVRPESWEGSTLPVSGTCTDPGGDRGSEPPWNV